MIGKFREAQFRINKKTLDAVFSYDLKVKFIEKLTVEQKNNLSAAKAEQGEKAFTEQFTCVSNPQSIKLDPFLKFPVSDMQDENYDKLLDVLYP